MGWLVPLLSYLGITPDKYPFLVLGILIVAAAFLLYLSIRNIRKSVEKIKLNIKAIVTFLASGKPKFNPLLIETMSPLRITTEGHSLLEKSGFKGIFDAPEHRQKILDTLVAQNPRTKLDVEKYAIVLFGTLLDEGFMNPVKTFLYNQPDARDSFSALAGLYIREEYLKAHPEITQ